MLIYKQRYKPRTSRAFTKSDLTVYDSAGNTALNALTVYGKSEVVSGAIKSAGEGWATVDLGTLDWKVISTSQKILLANFTGIDYIDSSGGTTPPIICAKYPTVSSNYLYDHTDQLLISYHSGLRSIWVSDNNYTDPVAFKAAMQGVLLCYKLADPTQGNAIAVKTDNGTGIDGTMAVFETGTPLRGIPDTDVRDVMQWDGSAGTVTKKCSKIRLADLTWSLFTGNPNFFYTVISNATTTGFADNGICNKYSAETAVSVADKCFSFNGNQLRVRDDDYTTVSDFVASLGDAELVYELATPTTTPLTSAENDSIAGLRTFEPQTHAQNNAQAEMTVNYTIRVPTI